MLPNGYCVALRGMWAHFDPMNDRELKGKIPTAKQAK